MDADTLLENFEILAEAPGGISRLRELVIALAVSGQIVKMRMPDDDTVDELLQCTAGKVDPYPEMSEKRFDIPLHWTWVPLASIARHQLGKMLNTGKMKGERVKYLRSVNVRQDGRIDLSDVKEMLIPIDELEKYSVKLDDVFVNEGGDVGRNAIWLIESEERFAFQNQLHRLRPICGVSSRYLQLVFRDAKSRGVIAELSSGVTIQHFSASSIRKLAIPLPPRAEQKRIVAKVDELMALCDQLEQQQKQRDNLRTATRKSAIDAISTATTPEELEAAWKRINNNWEVIADTPDSIESLRGLILGLAVTGRLVESGNFQLSEQVMSFESPTNIWATFSPKGWKCLSLEDASDQITDGTHQTPNYIETGVPFLSIKDISSGKLAFSRTRFISPKEHKKLTERVKPQRGDVLICRIGTLGRAISVDTDEEFSIFVSLGLIRPKDFVNPKFLVMLLNSPISYQQFDAIKAGGSHTVKLNLGSLRKYVLWIPSMEVQELILSKVDELMALCDQLEARLKVRSEVAEKFARSVVSAA